MERKLFTALARDVAQLLSVAALAVLLGTPAVAEEKLPEVTEDGLHLLKDTKARVVYARPGATLEPYSKVMLVDCFVAFVDDYVHDYNLDQLGLSGRITDKDIEKIKKTLADEFRNKFTEVLTKDGHAVVDEAGPDVLLLRPAIINLYIEAPDIRADFSRVIVDSAGQMTLYMEMYDSATSTLLARVIDPQADDKAFAQAATRVSNKAAADRIIKGWASLLSAHLSEVKQQKAAN
jgi:hypothetical protein